MVCNYKVKRIKLMNIPNILVVVTSEDCESSVVIYTKDVSSSVVLNVVSSTKVVYKSPGVLGKTRSHFLIHLFFPWLQ